MSLFKLNTFEAKETRAVAAVARVALENSYAMIKELISLIDQSMKTMKDDVLVKANLKAESDRIAAKFVEENSKISLATGIKSLELIWVNNEKYFVKEIRVNETNKTQLRKTNNVEGLEIPENFDIEEISKTELEKLKKSARDLNDENETLRKNLEETVKSSNELNKLVDEQRVVHENRAEELEEAGAALKNESAKLNFKISEQLQEIVALRAKLNMMKITDRERKIEFAADTTMALDNSIAFGDRTIGGSDRRSRRLDKSTPIFGKEQGVRIDNWLIVVENNFSLDRVEEDIKIMACLPYLRGSAFEMCRK